jgi:hypothetical protein
MISTVFLGVTEKKEKGTLGLRSRHLHIAIRGFVLLNLQNRPMSAICKCLPMQPELSTPP